MRLLKFAGVMLILVAAVSLSASGPVGIYGLIDKVVFEPNEQNAERIQLWGAFAYTDGDVSSRGGFSGLSVSAAKRGYLYFKIRSAHAGLTTEREVEATRNEWADLKAVAGSGQAIGFGRWSYVGGFNSLQPDVRTEGWVLERAPRGGQSADLRVRPASETPANPATYQTHVGLIKLDGNGRHAEIVKALKGAK